MNNNHASIEDRLTNLELKMSELTDTLHIEKAKVEIYRELLLYNTGIKLKGITVPVVKKTISKPVSVSVTPQAVEVVSHNEFISDTETVISDLFDKIRSNKTYSKSLSDLQKARDTLLPIVGLEKYKTMCNSHVTILTDIFTEKGFSDKKTETQISKGLSPLEMRLIKYTNYFNSNMTADDVRKITYALERYQTKPPGYVPLSISVVFMGLLNYGSVIASIKLNLQRVLFGSEGTNNIIYVSNPKSTNGDPFSFYILDAVSNNKRNWNMDCRLEEFTSTIRDNLLPFLIQTFRELYKDVFGDNTYRVGYKTKCQLTECDCEQLLTNIFIISSNNQLNNLLKNLVREYSTHVVDKNDKLNIQSDDAMQKRRWRSFCESEDSVTALLFDAITPVELKAFEIIYRTR